MGNGFSDGRHTTLDPLALPVLVHLFLPDRDFFFYAVYDVSAGLEGLGAVRCADGDDYAGFR